MEFRGERKRNPHPVHILSYSETSPKERGNVGTERRISKLENLEISWRESERLLSLFTYSATTDSSQRV